MIKRRIRRVLDGNASQGITAPTETHSRDIDFRHGAALIPNDFLYVSLVVWDFHGKERPFEQNQFPRSQPSTLPHSSRRLTVFPVVAVLFTPAPQPFSGYGFYCVPFRVRHCPPSPPFPLSKQLKRPRDLIKSRRSEYSV